MLMWYGARQLAGGKANQPALSRELECFVMFVAFLHFSSLNISQTQGTMGMQTASRQTTRGTIRGIKHC